MVESGNTIDSIAFMFQEGMLLLVVTVHANDYNTELPALETCADKRSRWIEGNLKRDLQ